MMGAVTIAAHEIMRRWVVWAAALALGLVPAVLIGADYHGRISELSAVALVVLSWVVAFVTGMTLLGQPLHDGRLAFYFTRPVRGFSIAGGKVLGGVVSIVGMELLLVLPLLVRQDGDGYGFGGIESDGVVATIALGGVFLAAGLVVGILARSRSRWFLFDALGGTVVTLVVVGIFNRINHRELALADAEATWADAQPLFAQVERFLHALLIAAICVTCLAVVTAIAIGRTDRERVHRALSVTLWSGLFVLALGGLAFSLWGLL